MISGVVWAYQKDLFQDGAYAGARFPRGVFPPPSFDGPRFSTLHMTLQQGPVMLKRNMRGLVKDLDGSGKLTTRETRELSTRWTMTHGFFASTGGFAFEIRDEDTKLGSSFLPSQGSGPVRLSLTARGMALLVKCGHLPDMSKADIADKSKANDIAKALVIIQASWMLIQVIGRLIARLPVTLLEVNTIAHV